MLKRLKIKFICINMLIVTAMLAVIFGMVLQSTSRNVEVQNSQTLQQLHQMQIHRGLRDYEIRTPYFMVLVSKHGTFSVSSSSFPFHEEEGKLVEIAQNVYNGEYSSGILKEYDLQYSRQKAPFGERIIFIDISRDRLIMRDLLKTCAIIAVLSLSVFFIISVVLAHWAVKPVDEAWTQQKQFVADASHELKTPLTVILTNAELLGGENLDSTTSERYIQSIQTMSQQMRGLVESLLDLARLDSGGAKLELAELNISRMAEMCLLPFEPLFYEHGLMLTSAIEEDLVVKGSEPHLRQVLDILLDNALKYSTPGSGVSLSLQRQGNHCVLLVSGRGEAISMQDLKNIFKRFYRIDKARAMNRSYGLGLSIAQSIVQEHNGKIWAESENGVNTFFVQLPLLR